MREDLRPWGFAPGDYIFRCRDCEDEKDRVFVATTPRSVDYPQGDKRSWRCKTHARRARDAALARDLVCAKVSSSLVPGLLSGL